MTTFELVHTTSYTYDDQVTTSYGQAHLALSTLPGQQVLDRELVISPAAAETREHLDYFGNLCTYFVVRNPHRNLSVTARSTVVVDRSLPDPVAMAGLGWQQVAQQCAQDPAVAEFTLASPRISQSAKVAAYARTVFTDTHTFGGAVAELLRRIHEDFRYRSGATTVLTGVDQLLDTRAGVCQDFAHLTVGCLRSVGLAARYVSGYLETRPAPGLQKLQGADASHAWAAVFAPGLGWIDLDPTNNQFVDERYLIAATGRDYGDVPPLKGVILTSAKHSSMKVSVDVTRV